MQKAIAIARREIGERSFVFIAAVVLTIAPALALIVPRGTFHDRLSAFALLSVIVAVGFTGGLSTILGVSLVGRELTEKRLSFYFSRPLSGAQIWFGKLIAALALVFGCAAIAFLPSLFFLPRISSSWTTLPIVAGYFIGMSLLLFAGGHTLSTMLRSRSVWLALDFAAAIAFAVALFAMIVPLILNHAGGLTVILLITVALAFVAIIVAGGAWQLARGRIDLRRNHRELSKFVWTSLAIVLVIVFAYTLWVTSVGPHDLTPISAHHAPTGSWMFVGGKAKHRVDYTSAFLYDVTTGASIPVPVQFDWIGTFDRAGKAAMWLEPTSPLGALFGAMFGHADVPLEVMITRLAPGAKPIHTGIVLDSISRNGDLRSDMSRIALLTKDVVAVYDVASRKSLGSGRVVDATSLRFLSSDIVLIFRRTETAPLTWLVRIDRFDVAHHELKTVFQTTARGNGANVRLADDNRTAIVRTWQGGALRIADPSPALRLYDITSGAELPVPSASTNVRVMRDGRLLMALRDRLQIYAGATLQKEIVVPSANILRIDGEVGPGQWVVTHEAGPRESDIVDINRGEVIARAPGLTSMLNSDGVPLFQDDKGNYVTWNWTTNERKTLF